MSWTDSLRYFKGVAARHGVESLKKDARPDDGIPLGARIGGLLKMQMSPFIRASAAGSLITMPTDEDTLICAIGRVKLDFPGKIYRYYVATGDDDRDREKFLQVVQDEHGEVVEVMYCTRMTRFIPETEEDQDAFTGEGGVGLGQKSYTLWREQLADNGYSEAEINAALGESEQLDYLRESGEEDFVPPFTGTEVRVDDAEGQHGLEQEIWFVPYVRQMADGSQEYLLITTEVVKSQDGDSSRREIHVDFMIGIPLEKERVTIQ
jgi:hypothetical protein